MPNSTRSPTSIHSVKRKTHYSTSRQLSDTNPEPRLGTCTMKQHVI